MSVESQISTSRISQVDVYATLMGGANDHAFFVKMLIENPAIAAKQPKELRVRLGLESYVLEDVSYL